MTKLLILRYVIKLQSLKILIVPSVAASFKLISSLEPALQAINTVGQKILWNCHEIGNLIG